MIAATATKAISRAASGLVGGIELATGGNESDIRSHLLKPRRYHATTIPCHSIFRRSRAITLAGKPRDTVAELLDRTQDRRCFEADRSICRGDNQLHRRQWHDFDLHLADLVSLRLADIEDGTNDLALYGGEHPRASAHIQGQFAL